MAHSYHLSAKFLYRYRPYDPHPHKLKKITDQSHGLLLELKKKIINIDELTPRELRTFEQVKDFSKFLMASSNICNEIIGLIPWASSHVCKCSSSRFVQSWELKTVGVCGNQFQGWDLDAESVNTNTNKFTQDCTSLDDQQHAPVVLKIWVINLIIFVRCS